MKDKLTKFISIFLAVLMIFGTAITNLNITKTYAQGNVIKEITTNRDTIQHGESFNLEVKFGGPGTKVNNGQIETIDFTPSGVRLTLPDLPIQLEDNRTNESLGEVKFEGNRATITFNEKASQLEDVQGGFHFSVFAYYTGEITEEGRGTIDITSGSITKHIELINRKGGHSTNNVYSKKGVRNDKYPDGNRVDWSFTFNAAHKPIYGTDVVFDVSDELPDTMEWDVEEINKNPYVLEYNKHWFNLKEARDMQFNIDFSGQNNRNLRIYIPAYILYGASWVQPLNATEVTVRLTAKIKDEVMKDPTIKYVKNTSDPKFSGPDDWKLEPKDFSDEVEIIRQGGWATGTVPGELKIIKVLKDKNIPLHDIVFTLERKDGQEFEYKDGDQVKHEKRINLVTNAEGIANVKGLRQGEYVVKEIIAPDWIVLDASKPIVREFTVSDRDTKGTELKIENEKKTTQIKVSKRWVDSAGKDLNDYPNIEVQLYRNDEPINKVTLEKGKLEHTWDNLEIADDTGKLYEYKVKEVNEENQSIKIDERWYSVNYEKDVNKDFVITNKQVPPLTPLVPPTRDIKVTKDWKDIKGDKANAPVEKIKVQLFKDGVKEGKEKELTKENGWETTFEKLPVSEKSWK
ncbi:Cna B-type domain-containing protein [Streptococcus equi]|uniref:Collagen adhesin n=1 Tax=Streptococcus equi subsp. zooepidemicus Sz4is TaxID=1381082 RepID=A0AAW3GJG2_STRSZ|nr:Collagen adhesin [Streptococcus equi subsp. zooepidemicus Sz4is]